MRRRQGQFWPLKGDRNNPAEHVESSDKNRQHEGEIEGSGSAALRFQSGRGGAEGLQGLGLTIVNEHELANQGGLFAEVREALAKGASVPCQEGRASDETRRVGAVLPARFANLKPVLPENSRGREVVEELADQREVIEVGEPGGAMPTRL